MNYQGQDNTVAGQPMAGKAQAHRAAETLRHLEADHYDVGPLNQFRIYVDPRLSLQIPVVNDEDVTFTLVELQRAGLQCALYVRDWSDGTGAYVRTFRGLTTRLELQLPGC
jgi:hypothetical protein